LEPIQDPMVFDAPPRFEIEPAPPLVRTPKPSYPTFAEIKEQILETGRAVVFYDFPHEAYNSKDEIFWRSTNLKGKTWNEFYSFQELAKKDKRESNKFFELGNYAEAVISGEPLDKWLIISKEDRPNPNMTMAAKENKLWWETATEGFASECIFEPADVEFMSFALEVATPDEQSLFDAIKSERIAKQLSIFWRCEKTGLYLKVRLDFYAATDVNGHPSGVIIDMKTTEKSRDQSKYAISDYEYRKQAALQISGILAAGLPFEEYRWLFFSKKKPYEVWQTRLETLEQSFADLDIAKSFAVRYARGEKRESIIETI